MLVAAEWVLLLILLQWNAELPGLDGEPVAVAVAAQRQDEGALAQGDLAGASAGAELGKLPVVAVVAILAELTVC